MPSHRQNFSPSAKTVYMPNRIYERAPLYYLRGTPLIHGVQLGGRRGGYLWGTLPDNGTGSGEFFR